MIFPGFPGVLSFFQVEWEPCKLPILVAEVTFQVPQKIHRSLYQKYVGKLYY